jgi:hypothetical protein
MAETIAIRHIAKMLALRMRDEMALLFQDLPKRGSSGSSGPERKIGIASSERPPRLVGIDDVER